MEAVRMSLFETLLSVYGYNEPIFIRQISYKNYSRPWINKEIHNLCMSGELARYEKGIYYIPTRTALGISVLNPQKVIEKKYINDGTTRIGYYSGMTFLNKLGLTTQMPNVIELYTNQETSRVREVAVGNQKVLLRRARIAVTEKNAAILSLLELMNFVPDGFFDDRRRKIVEQYILDNQITRKEISFYGKYFPDRAMRQLIESEVIYCVAR